MKVSPPGSKNDSAKAFHSCPLLRTDMRLICRIRLSICVMAAVPAILCKIAIIFLANARSRITMFLYDLCSVEFGICRSGKAGRGPIPGFPALYSGAGLSPVSIRRKAVCHLRSHFPSIMQTPEPSPIPIEFVMARRVLPVFNNGSIRRASKRRPLTSLETPAGIFSEARG